MNKPEGPTPGPWRFEINKQSKRIALCGGDSRFDMTVMDFVRWGMGGAQPRFVDEKNLLQKAVDFSQPLLGREHHEAWFQVATHPDMKLIESAPELLDSVDKLLSIVAFAISKGMPITQEVADARNAAVELLGRNGR